MRTTKTRLLSLILAVMMLVSMLSTVAFADDVTPTISPKEATGEGADTGEGATPDAGADDETDYGVFVDADADGVFDAEEVGYEHLQAAINDTANYTTRNYVLLKNDESITEPINANKSSGLRFMNLNLNTYTLTSEVEILLVRHSGAAVTISNGTISCLDEGRCIGLMAGKLTLEDVTIESAGACLGVDEDTTASPTVIINGGTLKNTSETYYPIENPSAQILNCELNDGVKLIAENQTSAIEASEKITYVINDAYVYYTGDSDAVTDTMLGENVVLTETADTETYKINHYALGEAAIGATAYATLALALAAAEANTEGTSTVKLLKDVEVAARYYTAPETSTSSSYAIQVNNSMTLDLNGHTLSSGVGVIRYGNGKVGSNAKDSNKLTIENTGAKDTGKIVCTGTGNNTLCMVRGNLEMTDVHIETKTAGNCITTTGAYGTDSTFTINGGSLTGGSTAVFVLGSGTKINAEITGTTITDKKGVEPLYIRTAENYGVTLGAGTVIEYTTTDGYKRGSGTVTAADGCYEDTTSTTTENEGKKYTTTIKEKFDIAFTNMTMGNSLAMSFAFEKANVESGVDYNAVITKNYADGRPDVTVTIPDENWKSATIDEKAHYYVTFEGIAAKEMTDNVRVQIFKVDGTAVSKEKVDTVRAYAMRALTDGTSSEAEMTMVVDMLNYGAAAQGYFENYNIDDLATSELTDPQKAYGTGTVSYTDNSCDKTNYVASRIGFKSNIQLQMLFTNIDQTMRAVVTYTKYNGTEKTIEIDGSKFVAVGTNYMISIEELVVADARQMITCVVCDSEGNEVAKATDSVESNVYRGIQDGEDTDLYEGIMKFADSAREYFATK